MIAQIHEGIALGPTGNLQESVKFYCLNTGHMLKWHSLMPVSMPERVIKQVNTIKAQEKQGCEFCFLNWWQEAFEWMVKVPKDNPEFQGLLENESSAAAIYLDVAAELPGLKVENDDDGQSLHVVLDDKELDFCNLATAASDIAGMDPADRMRVA
jgi:hypothetical protein